MSTFKTSTTVALALAALSGASAQTFPNCGTSVRKAWEDLSCEERTDYLGAVQLLKDTGRYDDFVTMHFDNNPEAHGTDTFLPWHRWFLWTFEKELQTVSQSCVTIPYWSWEIVETETQFVVGSPFASGPDALYTCAGVWSNPANVGFCTDTRFNTDAFGNTADEMCCPCGGGDRSGASCVDLTVGSSVVEIDVYKPNAHIFRGDAFGTPSAAGAVNCVSNGVAQNWMSAQSGGTTCLQRSFEPGQEPPHDEADMLNRIIDNPNYEQFRSVLEFGPHGAPHIWIGTNMANHYSPDDPLFYLHHANVDRMWALWQDYHDHDMVTPANAGTAQYSGIGNRNNPLPIDSSMPYINPGTLNFNAPGRNSAPTPRDMHASFGGMVSVTYGEDQLARTLQGQYIVNANWVQPAAQASSLNADGSCQSNNTPDACQTNPCQTGTCADVGGIATCDCTGTGFEGSTCQINVNDCFSGACNSGSCDDGINTFTCDCSNTGFEGANCETNINDCAGVNCGNGACVDGLNSFVCECEAGFTGDFCEINRPDCPTNACSNGVGVCVDGIDSYTCDCSNTGFTGDNCEININDCEVDSCSNGGVCFDGVNSFSCDCTGVDFTGTTCQDPIDTCFTDACANGGLCVDGDKTFTCDCSGTGFEGSTCETDVNECATDPCANGGICSNEFNSFTCDCSGTGFEGVTCQNNVDDCAGVDCGATGVCNDLDNGFECACQIGFSGDNCETNIDDCAGVDCGNGACVDGLNSFVCECQAGFTGNLCEINRPDCPAGACSNVGVCVDGIDSYTCDCEGTGFTGVDCAANINDCLVDSCSNGGVCVDGVNSFSCNCADTGFEGPTCSVEIPTGPTEFTRTTVAGEQAMHNAAANLYNNVLSCAGTGHVNYPSQDGSNCQQIWDYWQYCRGTIGTTTVTPSPNAGVSLCINWSNTVTQLAVVNGQTILSKPVGRHVLGRGNVQRLENAPVSTFVLAEVDTFMAQAPQFRSKFLRRDFAHFAEDYPGLSFAQIVNLIANAECVIKSSKPIQPAQMDWIKMMGMEDHLELFRC